MKIAAKFVFVYYNVISLVLIANLCRFVLIDKGLCKY